MIRALVLKIIILIINHRSVFKIDSQCAFNFQTLKEKVDGFEYTYIYIQFFLVYLTAVYEFSVIAGYIAEMLHAVPVL